MFGGTYGRKGLYVPLAKFERLHEPTIVCCKRVATDNS